MIPDGFTVVAGSLGDQGGAVALTLKRHGHHVRALSSSRWSPAASRLIAAGVEVLNDDLESPEVAVRDIAGAAHVFAAFTPFDAGGLQAELRRVRGLAWASVRAGVEHFVYASVGDPEQDEGAGADGLWGVERLLRQFDLPMTIFRPAFFMENVDQYALRRGTDGGLVLRTPLGERTVVPWVSLHDVASLVRLAFERPGLLGPGPVELGAEELDFAKARMLLSERLGEEIRYEQIAPGEVRDRHARGMYRWFQSYARHRPKGQHPRRLQPGLLTFRQWLEAGHLDLSKVENGTPAAA